MLDAVRVDKVPIEPAAGASADLLGALRTRGACFRSESASMSGRLDAEIDEGLWDLVARGMVTADAFSALRRCCRPGGTADPEAAACRRSSGRARPPAQPESEPGWARADGRSFPQDDAHERRRAPIAPRADTGAEELAEAVAWQLLGRGGESSPGSSGLESPTGFPGGTWCAHSAGSRPVARRWVGGSWPGSPASSTQRPEAVALLPRSTATIPRRRGRSSPAPTPST